MKTIVFKRFLNNYHQQFFYLNFFQRIGTNGSHIFEIFFNKKISIQIIPQH
jgi:hypothetical protein